MASNATKQSKSGQEKTDKREEKNNATGPKEDCTKDGSQKNKLSEGK